MRAYDTRAEAYILGAIFVDNDVVGWLDISPSDLSPQHAEIYNACLLLHDGGTPIDEVTVASAMGSRIDDVGGEAYIKTLSRDTAFTADNVEHYADIVRQKTTTRAVVEAMDQTRRAHSAGIAGTPLLDFAMKRLAEAQPTASAVSATPALVAEYDSTILAEDTARRRGEPIYHGVPTGIGVDRLTGGIPIGVLTMIGGLPSVGKSSLSIALADNAVAAGFGVHLLTYEDTARTYMERIAAKDSSVSVERVRAGAWSDGEFLRIREALAERSTSPGWLLQQAHCATAEQVCRSVLANSSQNNTKLVMIDYIQLMPPQEPGMRKNDAIEANMLRLNRLAGEGFAVVVFSQFNRSYSQRDDPRPVLADFRDSGSLEQIAKLVLALHDPGRGMTDDERFENDIDAQLLELLVLKNHQGQKDIKLPLRFDRPRCAIKGWEQ